MYCSSIMIKISCYPLIFILLSLVYALGAENQSHEANWLAIVQKRLELEQKPVDTFLSRAKPGNKEHALALNDALFFYNKQFDELYNDLMVIFKESDDWIALRDYLVQNKKVLDDRFKHMESEYIGKFQRKHEIYNTEIASYLTSVKNYYEFMMEVLKKVVTEGQAKEVELRKKEIKKLKKQERVKKLTIEETIRAEES